MANKEIDKIINQGQNLYIRDSFLRDRISGLNLESLAVLGDSNAEGYGWWAGVWANKNNKNDGYCAVLRELYPDARIDNYSVSGATLSNSNTYVKTQVDSMIASGYKYQHVIIQAGFNDLVQKAKTEDFVGICPYSKNECFNLDDSTLVGALSQYFLKIKKALPETKLHFILRESQYNNSSLYPVASYINMANELALCCNILGIDFWNFACDGISSSIPEQKALYYFDDVHWNEKAYREIITPLILNGLCGIPISVNNLPQILSIGTFTYVDAFSTSTTPSDNIVAFCNKLPATYVFNGIIFDATNNVDYGAQIIVKDVFVHIIFTRNRTNQVSYVEVNKTTGEKHQKTVTIGF